MADILAEEMPTVFKETGLIHFLDHGDFSAFIRCAKGSEHTGVAATDHEYVNIHGFLSKPISSEQLLSNVNRLIG